MAKVPVTIYIDENEKLVGTRVVPLASELAEEGLRANADGTSNVTSKVTYSGGQIDAEADVSWDI